MFSISIQHNPVFVVLIQLLPLQLDSIDVIIVEKSLFHLINSRMTECILSSDYIMTETNSFFFFIDLKM